jgi:aerobic carbon-monoxide dehydrogenase medium subunit
VIPHPFDYHVPTSADAAVELLRDAQGESALLAGGTWLVPALGDPAHRIAQVIDLRRAGLNGIVAHDDHVSLGATVTYTDLLRSDVVRRHLPFLALVAEGVTGGPQIQNQGTVGGSACAARPASDIPGALLAMDALAIVHGPGGRRSIPVADLWWTPFETTLAADELLVGFFVPVHPGGFAYHKLKFGTSSWPIVTVGAVAALDDSGAIAQLRVGVGAAAPIPFQLPLADLVGAGTDELAPEVADRAREAMAEPWSDELAPAAYRVAVLPAIIRRVVAAAITRAQEVTDA